MQSSLIAASRSLHGAFRFTPTWKISRLSAAHRCGSTRCRSVVSYRETSRAPATSDRSIDPRRTATSVQREKRFLRSVSSSKRRRREGSYLGVRNLDGPDPLTIVSKSVRLEDRTSNYRYRRYHSVILNDLKRPARIVIAREISISRPRGTIAIEMWTDEKTGRDRLPRRETNFGGRSLELYPPERKPVVVSSSRLFATGRSRALPRTHARARAQYLMLEIELSVIRPLSSPARYFIKTYLRYFRIPPEPPHVSALPASRDVSSTLSRLFAATGCCRFLHLRFKGSARAASAQVVTSIRVIVASQEAGVTTFFPDLAKYYKRALYINIYIYYTTFN